MRLGKKNCSKIYNGNDPIAVQSIQKWLGVVIKREKKKKHVFRFGKLNANF